MKVSVVIPFFQRKPGILRRAVTSVLAQKLPAGMELDIVIVDDGSPISAKSDLEGLAFNPPFHLALVSQPNSGVAAARNAGLRQVHDSEYIAFLDSDDIWTPEHLSIAIAALDNGFDYYFCDHSRVDSHESYFALIAFDPPSKPVKLPDGKEVLEIEQEWFFDYALRQLTSLASTLVYRKSIGEGIFFDDALTAAGEDCLFFNQLIARARRVCYCPKVMVNFAEGVNIWQSRYGWDKLAHRASHLCILLSEQKMLKVLPLSDKNKLYLSELIKQRRKFFAYLTVRWFVKNRDKWPKDMVKMVRSDHSFWCWYPLNVLYVLILAPLRLYKPDMRE